MIDFGRILGFWFGEADVPRKEHFGADAAFDARVRELFAEDLAEVLHGSHPPRTLGRDDRLAIIILTDQLTRNMYRGTPRAYEGDVYAFDAAQYVIAAGQDETLSPLRRSFVYMPFLHAEDIRVQGQSLMLFRKLASEAASMKDALKYAEQHYATVARFGRFPERNGILGRPSTAEEKAFLAKSKKPS
jgi:uncharacterized protein (DUF924 family)